MPLRNTEQQNDLSSGLDLCRPAEILSVLHDGQVAASNSVASAIPDIEAAAQAAAKRDRVRRPACLCGGPEVRH